MGKKLYWAELAPRKLAEKKNKNWGDNPSTKCRFCGKIFARKDTADKHERDVCTFPGAPHHVCFDDGECPTRCIGPRESEYFSIIYLCPFVMIARKKSDEPSS